MVSAIVMLNIVQQQINEVAQALAAIDGVSEVFSVAGRFDLVAIVRVANNEALADLVTSRVLKVEGITDSETMIAFKVFSRYDLEQMFAIGIDEP